MIVVCVCLCVQSRPTLCHPMNYSPQAPLSLEFSRQGYWSRSPSPGDRPNVSWESNLGLWRLMHWQVDSLPLPQEAQVIVLKYFKRSSMKMLLINLCTWYFFCLFEGLSRQKHLVHHLLFLGNRRGGTGISSVQSLSRVRLFATP